MKKMEAQPVNEADLATILALHKRRLGWSYLLENTIADRVVGFPCEAEEFAVRRQLREAFQKVSEWFRTTGQKEKWPFMEGWVWEIDFESGQAMPKRQRSQTHQEAQEQDGGSCLVEGPIMTVGDMDLDIIKRLLEKRDAVADQARSHLRVFLNGEFGIGELSNIIQELGTADKDVRDWFSAMATTHNWPRIEDIKWVYRVDIPEKQVYLTRR